MRRKTTREDKQKRTKKKKKSSKFGLPEQQQKKKKAETNWKEKIVSGHTGRGQTPGWRCDGYRFNEGCPSPDITVISFCCKLILGFDFYPMLLSVV